MHLDKPLACIHCNPDVQAALFDESFLSRLAGLLVIFAVLIFLVWLIIHLYARQHNRTAQPGHFANPVPLLRASMVLGIGIGGFIDGILFHQVLQWHQMLSNVLAPTTVVSKSVNMFWDGIFHAGMLTVVVIGVILLWKLCRKENLDTSGRMLSSGYLIGWGMFNIVEGIIDHHVLGLHNVREVTAHPALWNYGFLGMSALFILIGVIALHTYNPVVAKSRNTSGNVFM